MSFRALSPVSVVKPVSRGFCGKSVTAIKPVSRRLCGMSFRALSPVSAVKPVSQGWCGKSVTAVKPISERCCGKSFKIASLFFFFFFSFFFFLFFFKFPFDNGEFSKGNAQQATCQPVARIVAHRWLTDLECYRWLHVSTAPAMRRCGRALRILPAYARQSIPWRWCGVPSLADGAGVSLRNVTGKLRQMVQGVFFRNVTGILRQMVQVYSSGMSPASYDKPSMERWPTCILSECHRQVTATHPWRDSAGVSFGNVTCELRQPIHEEIVQVYSSGMSPPSYGNTMKSWCRCILQECHQWVRATHPWRDGAGVSLRNVTG